MFTKKSRESKDDFWISFKINDVYLSEYIPQQYSKYEYRIRSEYLNLLFKLNRYYPNFYYWHIRHNLMPDSRKSEDLLFMTHVYNDHDGVPSNRREKMFFKHLRSIYGLEYDTLIAPKISLEKNGDVPTHEYALAYYKRWLRKPRPVMKQLYHGVDFFEFGDIFTELEDILNYEKDRYHRKEKYLKKQLKNNTK